MVLGDTKLGDVLSLRGCAVLFFFLGIGLIELTGHLIYTLASAWLRSLVFINDSDWPAELNFVTRRMV